ncbi:MAG: hypothetical protein LC796_16435 [Acidobacteria bacterium]|nr:hypothetical protein [Acidobacteriota bacterium]MCA1612275.1 hypothetical protein [Acidobacteriota bacterium]
MFRLAKPLILAGFAGVLALLAGLLLFDTPLEYALECDRAAGRCTFTQKLVSKTRTGSAAIASLRQAEIRVATPRRGRPRISVWILGTGGPFFVADYASREQAGADAGGIDRFLHDPTLPMLSVRREEAKTYRAAWIFLAVSAAVLASLGVAFFSRRRGLSRAVC